MMDTMLSGNHDHDAVGPSPTHTLGEHNSKNLISTFPIRLYELLDLAARDNFEHVISWLPSGSGFKVHDKDLFQKMILGTYFNQSQYKSFTRQLSIYGFERILSGAASGGYEHRLFKRGDVASCKVMKRERVQHRSRNRSRQKKSSPKEILVKSFKRDTANTLVSGCSRAEEELTPGLDPRYEPEPIFSIPLTSSYMPISASGKVPSDIANAIIELFQPSSVAGI